MDKIGDLLVELAKKLGTTAEHLWPLLVAKTRFDYIGTALVLTFMVIASLVNLGASISAFAKGDVGDRDIEAFYLVASIIVTVGLAVGWSIHLANLGTLVFPEAATVENLLSAIGGHR